MDINHAKKGEITIITIKGRLDGTTAPVADKTIKKILEGNCSRMLFDCSELNYLSCVGLRIMLGAVKGLKRKAGKIVLCCLTDFVKEIFEVSGFDSMIPQPALVESQIGKQVFVVNADNKVETRNVEVGRSYKNQWIIQKGLKKGEKVIVEGTQKVRPGVVVNPKTYSAKKASSG